jgi:hypothetical protein
MASHQNAQAINDVKTVSLSISATASNVGLHADANSDFPRTIKAQEYVASSTQWSQYWHLRN